MGKARILGQNRPFVPNRYADMRRRQVTTFTRFERMHIQAEERKAEARKAKQEMEDKKK